MQEYRKTYDRVAYLARTGERRLTNERAASKVHRRMNPEFALWDSAKRRAAERGIEFTIEPRHVVIPEYCPALGIRLMMGRGHLFVSSPSIDRIDSSRGYTPDNIWVICHRANTIKNDSTLDELRQIVHAVESRIARGPDIPRVVEERVGRRRGKLTASDVECLRFWISQGVPQQDLAKAFGVTSSTLSDIWKRKRWNGDWAGAPGPRALKLRAVSAGP